MGELRTFFLRLQPSTGNWRDVQFSQLSTIYFTHYSGNVSNVYHSSPCLEEWESIINNKALKNQDYSICIAKVSRFSAERVNEKLFLTLDF